MNTKEALQEQYEDAYLALLMDAYAREKAAALLKECEANDEAISDAFEEKCTAAIDAYFRKNQPVVRRFRLRKILLAAAMTVVIVCVLFTTAFAFSERFRNMTRNLMIETQEQYTDIQIQETDSSDLFSDMELGWLPPNFTLVEYEPDLTALFEDPEGHLLSVLRGYNGGIVIDTEDPDYMRELNINGNDAVLIYKKNSYHLTLTNLRLDLIVDIICDDCMTEEEFLRIAEEIRFYD